MMHKRFEQLETSIQKQERERAARDVALLEAALDWHRRQRSFWARWGRIWWWPAGGAVPVGFPADPARAYAGVWQGWDDWLFAPKVDSEIA